MICEKLRRKDDKGKPAYNFYKLIPPLALREVDRVLTRWWEQYEAHNWAPVDDAESAYVADVYRRIRAYSSAVQRGDSASKLDADTGHHQLAYAVASLLFALELDLKKEMEEMAEDVGTYRFEQGCSDDEEIIVRDVFGAEDWGLADA